MSVGRVSPRSFEIVFTATQIISKVMQQRHVGLGFRFQIRTKGNILKKRKKDRKKERKKERKKQAGGRGRRFSDVSFNRRVLFGHSV